MGRDMHLYKVKKTQSNLTPSAKDIVLVDEYLNYINNEDSKNYTFEEWTGYTETPSQKLIDAYTSEVEIRYGSYDTFKKFPYHSIMTMIKDWRKANAIHEWFVIHTQNGQDECQPSFVDKEQFEELLTACQKVLSFENNQVDLEIAAKTYLPTTTWFFFGSQNYDDYYIQYIKEIADLIKNILKDDDFDTYYYIYHASW